MRDWDGSSGYGRRLRTLERAVHLLYGDEAEYLDLRRLMWRNFLGGVVRGVGSVIGIALIGTVGVYLLTNLAEHILPGLADSIAELVKWVQRKL